MRFLILSLILSLPLSSFAQSNISSKDTTSGAALRQLDRFGMNYFSFWEGPSLADGQTATNELGGPLDDGLSLFNLISITYKLTDRWALDLQNRLEIIHTQEQQQRFQGMRLGVSGKLLSGEKWSLKGAANTDIPELNGRDARARKTIFNPGLFAGFNYQFDPRWSLYAIVSPRIFFYSDNEAVEPEWEASGRDPGEKPRAILALSPTLNYSFNDKIGARTGLDLSFRQFVKNEANYLRRWPTAMTMGPTFNLHKSLNLYPYVQTWPFDGQKMTLETASVGMWINGVIF